MMTERAEHGQHRGDLLRVEAGEHLVREEERRPGGEGAPELETLFLRDVELARGDLGLVGEAERREDLLGDRSRGPKAQVLASKARPDGHVRDHRQVVERTHDLVRARDASTRDLKRSEAGDLLAAEHDPSAARSVHPVYGVEKGGLSRAVRADEAEDLALLHRERRRVARDQPAEPHRDRVDLEDHWM